MICGMMDQTSLHLIVFCVSFTFWGDLLKLIFSNTLHDELIQRLVRDGYDQCQLAYRKLVNKKFYKLYRASLHTGNRSSNKDNRNIDEDEAPTVVPFMGQNCMEDTREFTLDAINQAMEDILSKFRWYSKSLQSHMNDSDASMNSSNEYRTDTSSGEGNSRSSDATNTSFHQQLFASNSQKYHDLLHPPPNTVTDNHPFANKKRRKKIIITTSGISTRKRKKAKQQRTNAFETSSRNISDVNLSPGQHDRDKATLTGSDLNRIVDNDSFDIVYEDGFNPTRRRNRTKSTLHRRKHRAKQFDQEIDKQRKVDDSTSIDDANVAFHTENENENDYDSFAVPSLSKIPEIENILRPTKSVAMARNRGGTIDPMQRGPNKDQKISDRMKKWLQVNDRDISNADECENDDPQQNESSTDRLRRRGERHKRKRQGVTYEDSTANSVIPTTTIDETKVFLFSKLFNRQTNKNKATLPDCSRPINLVSVCARMESLPQDAMLQHALDEVCTWFDDTNVYTTSDASLAFQTMLDLLCKDGTSSLQDLISNENPALDRYISILVSIFGLIRRNVHHRLTPDDGVLFAILGEDRCKVFVEFCVLQLVDAVMSLFQPKAWALQIQDVKKVICQLEPLRNELALHMHLTERICELILHKLPPQEWRCVRDGQSVFVSSINPDDWEVLLASGVQPQWSKSVRFAAFANVIPRCEVDAIWCSLAFVAGVETPISNSDTSRWCLLSQLFFKGSLSVDENAAPIPPELDQVKAAIEDLRNMIDLIMSGAMETLPKRDNFLLDVIQKSLLLEADYSLSNEYSHETPRNILAFFHEDMTIDSSMSVSGDFNSFLKNLCSTNVSGMGTKHQLPLPSSQLLRCCLALLLVWKRQIPFDKMKRLQCLKNAVKSFTKQISSNGTIGDYQTIIREDEVQVRDAFSDAFSDAFNSPTKESNCTNTETKRVSFLKESAAYITIFESASFDCIKGTLTSKVVQDNEFAISKVVWDLLSNDEMQIRQQWIVTSNRDILVPRKFYIDASTLYIAAKAMSLIGIMFIDETLSSSNVFASSVIDGCASITERISSIKFVISCLVTCIHVACNFEHKSDILSCVFIYAAFILKALDSVRQNCIGITSELDTEIKSLAEMILKTNMIQRAFYKILGTDDLEGSIHVRCFVSFTLTLMKIFGSERDVELSLPSVEETRSLSAFDTYDDIDDDVLANINLDPQVQQSKVTQDVNEIVHSIYKMLINALEISKPSNRNAIASNDQGDTTNKISSYGMKLVAKHFNDLCKIIADIISIQWRPQCPTMMFWNSVYHLRDLDDHNNAQYFKDVSRSINFNLCMRHNLVIVQDIVRRNVEPFIFSCLESMMNLKLLRRLPSCNLNRIGKEGATAEEERGFNELIDFRSGSLFRLNEGLTEMRDFCGSLSRILLAEVDGDEISHFNALVGNMLHVFSNDAQSSKFVPSLERECFQRFVLFRCLISETAICESYKNMFERLSIFLLLTCSSGLQHALEKIVILDQAILNVKGNMYSRSKLLETVACLTELHVNVVSEILRCHYKKPYATSQNFDIMILHIRDGFVAPILVGKDVTPLSSLRNLTCHCISFLKGKKLASRISGNVSSNFDMQLYCNMYQNSLVRRSREFLLSMNINNFGSDVLAPNTLLLGLLHASMGVGDNEAAIVGQAFTASSYYLQLFSDICRSPFEIAIDDYYTTIEGSEQLSVSQVNNLRDYKVYALSAVVVPILTGEYKHPTYGVNETCLFRFMQSILLVSQDYVDRVNNITFEVLLICAIVKQFGVALRNEVLCCTKITLDESLIELIFKCGRSVLTLPANLVDPKAFGWLVDWACPSTSTNAIHFNYIWHVCCWIRTLGNMILYERDSHLHTLRRGSVQDLPKTIDSLSIDSPIWIPLGDLDDNLNTARYLNELEETLFARPVIVQPEYLKANKYVTGRTQQKMVESIATNQSFDTNEQLLTDGRHKIIVFDDWLPSNTLRSAICQFNEKIQFATPSRNSLHDSVD